MKEGKVDYYIIIFKQLHAAATKRNVYSANKHRPGAGVKIKGKECDPI